MRCESCPTDRFPTIVPGCKPVISNVIPPNS